LLGDSGLVLSFDMFTWYKADSKFQTGLVAFVITPLSFNSEACVRESNF